MASRPLQTDRDIGEEATTAGRAMLGPAGIAAAMSVGLSWLLFFAMDERERGIFVGLWPPTILSFATYLRHRRLERKIDSVTSPGQTLWTAIEEAIGR